MATRTFACLNRRCKNEFDSQRDHPPCPLCQGLKVKWVPKGFAIVSKSTGYDATIKTLADRAGLTNVNDPRAGQRAAPHAPNAVKYVEQKFGSFSGKVGLDARGAPVPTCLPNGMTDTVAIQVTSGQQPKFTPSVAVPHRQGDRTVMAPLRGPTPKIVAKHKGAS